jgi:hypothetical protein
MHPPDQSNNNYCTSSAALREKPMATTKWSAVSHDESDRLLDFHTNDYKGEEGRRRSLPASMAMRSTDEVSF